jgi:HlyD family secretion protein
MRKNISTVWVLLVFVAFLAGCSGTALAFPEVQSAAPEVAAAADAQSAAADNQPAAAPGAEPAVASVQSLQPAPQPMSILNQTGAGGIVAKGSLVPGVYVNLSFNASGNVTEVLVADGDTVADGQVLARLRTSDSRAELERAIADANSAVATAQKNLLNAQNALDLLNQGAEAATAQAQLDLANAKVAYDAAVSKVKSAKASRSNPSGEQAAKAELVLAQTAYDKALANYTEVANKPDTNLQKAQRTVELDRAEQRLLSAQVSVDWYNSAIPESELAILEGNLAIAKANLDATQAKYDLLRDGPDPTQVALAQAAIDQAKADLEAAQARLVAAKAALDDTELRAPIAGKVVTQKLKSGEVALPGNSVMTVADFSSWFIETDDLTELDVVNVDIGQKVTVSPESLPDVHLNGEVVSISDSFTKDASGKILYTVRIRLSDIDARLRWGMTMVVSFPTE